MLESKWLPFCKRTEIFDFNKFSSKGWNSLIPNHKRNSTKHVLILGAIVWLNFILCMCRGPWLTIVFVIIVHKQIFYSFAIFECSHYHIFPCVKRQVDCINYSYHASPIKYGRKPSIQTQLVKISAFTPLFLAHDREYQFSCNSKNVTLQLSKNVTYFQSVQSLQCQPGWQCHQITYVRHHEYSYHWWDNHKVIIC